MKCNKCLLDWPPELFKSYSWKHKATGERLTSVRGCCVYCSGIDAQITRHRKRGDILPWPYFPDYNSWATKVQACGGACPQCRRVGRLTIDHIVQFAHGGLFDIQNNFRPLCKTCNSSRSRAH